MEDVVTIVDIVKSLKKKWKLVTLITILVMLLGSIPMIMNRVSPKKEFVYRSDVAFIVDQKLDPLFRSKPNQSEFKKELEYVPTYLDFIKTDKVFESALESLDINYNKKDLQKIKDQVVVFANVNSKIITVGMESSEEKYQQLPEALIEAIKEEAGDILGVRGVTIVSMSDVTTENMKFIYSIKVVPIAAMSGFIFACACVILIDLLKKANILSKEKSK